MKSKILIADDEESIRITFFEFLTDAGYQVETADTLESCIEKMQAESFDLLFLDVLFGVENGIEAIAQLKTLQPDCAILIMTGSPTPETISRARQCGAMDYRAKPIHQASLLYLAEKALTSKR